MALCAERLRISLDNGRQAAGHAPNRDFAWIWARIRRGVRLDRHARPIGIPVGRQCHRLPRTAWRRIKTRLAEPKTVTVFKGRSVGATMGTLERMADLFDVGVRVDETDEELAGGALRPTMVVDH